MTGQQLRNSILQEAIQGRLVPNVLEPGEKTGVELLQDILAERQKKEDKDNGKKARKLTLSSIEEEPYELPDGWCWCKIGDIADIERGGNFKKSDFVENGYPCIHYGQIHMKLGPRTYSVLSFLSPSLANKQRKAHTGDIVMAVTSENIEDVCKCTAWLGDYDVAIGAHTAIIRHYLDPIYLVYFFKSSLFYSQKKELGHGSKVVEVTPITLNSVILPLPPLSIQKAIVAKIEELLPLVDEYDQAAGELETLNKILPDKLRKSVLQEAIHGNLVPNDIPEGEATGAELLQQILKERQDRENKEKGKKAKKLTLSTIEEDVDDLPEGWCWCKLSDIGDCLYGVSESAKTVGSYKLLRITDIQNDSVNWDSVPLSDYKKKDVAKYFLTENDLVFARTGGTVGKSYLIQNAPSNSIYASYLIRVRFQGKALLPKYIKYFFQSPQYWSQIIENAEGTGQPNCNGTKLANLNIPLPPLSIQHRIVEKIEEVFAAIDNLPA